MTEESTESFGKRDIAASIAEALDMPMQPALRATDLLLAHIQAALLAGQPVVLKGVGRLVTVTRKPRLGRNPVTGEAVSIPERRAVKFTAGIALDKALKAGK